MEIGSVYEINPNCIENMDSKQSARLRLAEVDKYRRQNIVFTASAREAIELALYSLEKENPAIPKKCLMPAYMCDTVFIPFAHNGWELCFYHIGKDMKADVVELQALIENEKPGMLFIHDYYGEDTWKDLRVFLAEWQKRDLLIMEDVTQAYYLNVDTQADYVVGSLRKWYAIPDGGFITTNKKIYEEVMVKDDAFAMERFQMLSQKWNYLEKVKNQLPALNGSQTNPLKGEKEEYLSHNRELEERLDQYEQITAISDLSKSLLIMMDEEACKERRNANYRILAEGLKDKKILMSVMRTCEQELVCNEWDVAPLYYPVYMENREELQGYLRERDIYVPILWPIGKENEAILNETEQYIFDHIAAIPMDQRYAKEDMERIVAVIQEYEETH